MSARIGAAAFIAALAVSWLLGAAAVRADDGARIVVSQVDATGFPDVRIVASVTDAQGRPLRGLVAGDLTVSESGVPLRATVDLASQSAPVALALVLDTSGSMVGQPLADAKSAMAALIRSLGPSDRAALLTFDSRVRIERDLTDDKTALIAAANGAVASGNTAVYDALATAASALAGPTKARRAIVLLTDGVDNSSRATAAGVVEELRTAQIPTYVIGLGSQLDRRALTTIASGTPGGRFIEAPSSADLAAIYADLSEQILTQYSVVYRSGAAAAAGTAIPIELALRRDGAHVARTTVSYPMPRTQPVVRPTPAPVATPEAATALTPAAAAPRAVVPRMPSEIIALLGGAAVLTLLLWISELVSSFPSRQQRRLEIFVRALALTAGGHAKRRSIVQRILVPSIRSASRPLQRVTPAAFIDSTREQLQAAGEPMGLGPVEFIGVRAGSAMLAGIAGLASTLAITGGAGLAPIGGLGGAVIGFALPAVVLGRFGSRRKAAIRRAMPAALDMLALSTEAGLSFDGALGQVARRWSTPLSEEIRRLLVEFQMGRDRRHSLRELGLRTGVPELGRFASAVIQADSLGVPLSRVLHEQSAEIRQRRRLRADEAARKAPVKMLFPMVFLIFPALFVVVLGPAIPRLLEAFRAFE